MFCFLKIQLIECQKKFAVNMSLHPRPTNRNSHCVSHVIELLNADHLVPIVDSLEDVGNDEHY